MVRQFRVLLAAGGLAALLVVGKLYLWPLIGPKPPQVQAEEKAPPSREKPVRVTPPKDPHGPDEKAGLARPGFEWQLPNNAWKMPFKDEQPITFVTRSKSAAEWDKLASFWNEMTENVTDPLTGKMVQRKAVRIKVPLGLTSSPPIPVENPLTVARWALGKKLYFDPILSSDGNVACASCHNPRLGYTDRSPVSTGIRGLKGGMSAPTVFNSGYHQRQFWDGRASSLEDQAQGPVQNPVEMFSGAGHAWNQVIERLRAEPNYVQKFRSVFGTEPTRDGVAKAIACYERTVLSGNSIHDRADRIMRQRVEDEETGKLEILPKDYAKALNAAFTAKDEAALKALGLDVSKDAGRVAEVAKSINEGRKLFFNKARCSTCHVGDNFTDNTFHNLGVGVKDGKLPAGTLGRFGAQPTGEKDPRLVGAFKTPTLRHLLGTAPYMHNGSERTLEEVVDFYDRGGNANEYLDPALRDYEAEKACLQARADNKEYKGPKVFLFGEDRRPVVPLELKLTPQEKKDLVLFLRALQGDPADPIVADPEKMPR